MERIGVDVGYNGVKARSAKGAVHFPSAVGPLYTTRFKMGQEPAGIKFEDPARAVVGDAAITFSRLANRREDRAWIESEPYYLLFLAALSELVPDSGKVKIVTGLPVKYFDDKDDLVRRLKKVHRFKREGRSLQVIDVDATVIPQPFGTLFDYALNERGMIRSDLNGLLKKDIGIIDIGGKTTNFLHVSKLNEIPNETTSIDAGGWMVVDVVKGHLDERFKDLILRDHEISSALKTGMIDYMGKDHSIQDAINEASRLLSDSIIAEATRIWSIGRFSRIFITGGGSFLVGHLLKEVFQNAILVENPVEANSRGFFKFAMRD